MDHLWNGTVQLSSLQILALDEADRLLDRGFAPQVHQMLDALPAPRQTLLFSATIPDNLSALARMSLRTPERVIVVRSATPAVGIAQTLDHTTPEDKRPLLQSLLEDQDASVWVFPRSEHRADRSGRLLARVGSRVAVLHGNRWLSQRRMVLEGFRHGRYQLLGATDIAARGLDVAHIAHVIDYDLPYTPED